jgi:prolyl-tRNA editing enzyme YbaK/EbsC (Cys-tRNA(Pro) deacylase)
MDEDLMQYDLVWGAGGTPQTVFPITPKELSDIAGVLLGDVKQ